MGFTRSIWLATLAAGLFIAGCSSVPDYLVEGRLPHFGKDDSAVAQAEAPPPPPVAVQAPAESKTHKAHDWHMWPKKRDEVIAPQVAATPESAPVSSPSPAQMPASSLDTQSAPEPTPPPAPQAAEAAPETSTPAAAPPKSDRAKHSIWPSKESQPVITGGYQKATDNKAVEAAAAFALHESPLYQLRGVKSAQMQIVAGTNYRLCLKVRQVDHEANPFHERMVLAQVFQGLDQHYELVSWQEVNICE